MSPSESEPPEILPVESEDGFVLESDTELEPESEEGADEDELDEDELDEDELDDDEEEEEDEDAAGRRGERERRLTGLRTRRRFDDDQQKVAMAGAFAGGLTVIVVIALLYATGVW